MGFCGRKPLEEEKVVSILLANGINDNVPCVHHRFVHTSEWVLLLGWIMAVLYIIYLTFVGVGVQSGVMGSVWPIMRLELGLPLGVAGVLKSLTSGATVIAALDTHRFVRRATPGKVALVSVTMMALGFLGYAWSSSLASLLFFSIPLGLGVGYIDTSMNNYTALHYEAKHMNWLHSFWGIGASLGPALIALALSVGFSYRVGWSLIGALELSLAVALIFCIKSSYPKQQIQPPKRG